MARLCCQIPGFHWVILPIALVLNAVIGRTIHWDIAAVIAALGFLGLTLAYRYAR